MSYKVMRSEEGKPWIALNGEPPFCRALEAAPFSCEPELSEGWWLVMVFAAWSTSDINAIQTALDASKHFGGILHLGLRPFDDPTEHSMWCPDLSMEGNTPTWVLLSDGMVFLECRGMLTVDDLVHSIKAIILKSGTKI